MKGHLTMATRTEKIYRTNSLKLLNNVLNFIDEYRASKKRIDKKECELIKNITTDIDKFFNKNSVTDEELRIAVERK
jgi:hypothetical protein